MPSVRAIAKVLREAGLVPSDVVPARAGQRAEDSRGFRVRPSNIDRRVAHVFHYGRGQRLSLEKYAEALRAAGYLVGHARGGLKIETARNVEDRAKEK